MDIRAHNRDAWNRLVAAGNRWTVPVSPGAIAAARRGDWEIVLTPQTPVPREWFPELSGLPTLCLASGGGQQGPILAAAGARVTVFDNSPAQLAQDRLVADREGLALETVEGDMRDLGAFADESFGLIFHPCSNGFVPEVWPVWREAFRVLRSGGVLLAGFANPVLYLFDEAALQRGELSVRFKLPYSDLTSLSDAEREARIARGEPLEFSHSLDELIGAQLEAGFVLTGFFEDGWPGQTLDDYLRAFIATRAVKP